MKRERRRRNRVSRDIYGTVPRKIYFSRVLSSPLSDAARPPDGKPAQRSGPTRRCSLPSIRGPVASTSSRIDSPRFRDQFVGQTPRCRGLQRD